jgi:hypothetical protein
VQQQGKLPSKSAQKRKFVSSYQVTGYSGKFKANGNMGAHGAIQPILTEV